MTTPPSKFESVISTRQIENYLVAEHERDRMVHKLLLIGAGESGKSTLFKQIFLLYSTGFSQSDREHFLDKMRKNVIESMKTLIDQSSKVLSSNETIKVSSPSVSLIYNLTLPVPESYFAEVIEIIKELWKDQAILKTFEKRNQFSIMEAIPVFFNKVEDIFSFNYTPSDDDILLTRVRTTGISEKNFTISGEKFSMYDVGGQKSERRKWIHLFSDVTAVIFVGSLSEYDKNLEEGNIFLF